MRETEKTFESKEESVGDKGGSPTDIELLYFNKFMKKGILSI